MKGAFLGLMAYANAGSISVKWRLKEGMPCTFGTDNCDVGLCCGEAFKIEKENNQEQHRNIREWKLLLNRNSNYR